MPIPQITRVNPLDLQGNIAIGVSLPFDGPVAFNSTYSTTDQIKSNLLNLLLTNKGERLYNPEFGADLKTAIFENITDEINETINRLIVNSVSIFVPEVRITNVDIMKEEDTNTILVTVQYKINISGKADQITVQFI